MTAAKTAPTSRQAAAGAHTPSQRQPHKAVAEPRAAPAVKPTPTQAEIDAFRTQQANGTLPQMPWHLAPDGSPVSPGAFNPSQGTPTWP